MSPWHSCLLPFTAWCQIKMPALPTSHWLPWLLPQSLASIWPALLGPRGPSLAQEASWVEAGVPGAVTK